MRRARSGVLWLAIAVAVHAGLLLGVRPRARVPAPAAADQADVETEVLPEEPAPAPSLEPARAEASPALVKTNLAKLAAAAVARARAIEGASAEPEAPSAEPAAGPARSEGEPGSGSGWSLQPGLALDVTSRDALARATRPLAEGDPNKGNETWGVGDALDAHDSAIGLGRGGPVLAALENALGADDAPFEGAATFDVAIHTDGRVSMSLVDASDGAEKWRRVGETTERSFDPKQVRIPPGTRGWHVVVRLEAKVQYPNGLDPKKLGVKVEKGPTSVAVAARGKVCSVRLVVGLTLFPIQGGCDPDNIGLNPLRVVHGHILSEGRL